MRWWGSGVGKVLEENLQMVPRKQGVHLLSSSQWPVSPVGPAHCRAAWGLGDDVASRARFASGNFFEWQQGSQAVYDLGFDYT